MCFAEFEGIADLHPAAQVAAVIMIGISVIALMYYTYRISRD
jgi:hypothetical protein